MRLRTTLLSRMNAGVEAKLKARTQRQKRAVLEATARLADEEYSEVVGTANRDTGFMADQTRLEFTYGGYGYRVGYRRADFVGQTNPVTQKVIDTFYPPLVHDGTRLYAGNPFLTVARRRMRPRIRRAYARALSGDR